MIASAQGAPTPGNLLDNSQSILFAPITQKMAPGADHPVLLLGLMTGLSTLGATAALLGDCW